MTVKELKSLLNYYDDDMNVKVGVNRRIKNLVKVTDGVDIDINMASVWLLGDDDKNDVCPLGNELQYLARGF